MDTSYFNYQVSFAMPEAAKPIFEEIGMNTEKLKALDGKVYIDYGTSEFHDFAEGVADLVEIYRDQSAPKAERSEALQTIGELAGILDSRTHKALVELVMPQPLIDQMARDEAKAHLTVWAEEGRQNEGCVLAEGCNTGVTHPNLDDIDERGWVPNMV